MQWRERRKPETYIDDFPVARSTFRFLWDRDEERDQRWRFMGVFGADLIENPKKKGTEPCDLCPAFICDL